ncbi:ParB family chromosome partitioning protein [Rhodovulum sulfidophilum]|uniref:plasmid partitioning protein RepB C-terminal domain-containing protein n=1 Tax=Rhodovulum sulfidophilum TaxID=35806 RepID=UPI0005A9B7D7|nr:plasmid partitioning protein RepB C-terminal domain-containing protein [Rhodovulum sulfidophilum]ANB34425.1 chromosome partitioning protein ParB [Rhodovulum sulfidophilum DSM 1374]ANB38248.1 chromosome partitioning protein ParB [Rhodovulum sulfidophilum]MCW2303590.1 ParB family chromosome partitioning protein [Rhodovulum sulfidophilum]
MPDDMEPTSQKQVTLIPCDRIRILNPRVRNRRTFEAMVENIARIGLKRPITVAPRAGTDPQEYDLVCGQGRLEAFIELKQDQIPAIVIEADESDCLVMSLVENCARRQHNPIDLMREIGSLRERGYNDRQIGEKIGVSYEYVNMIAGLLEKGEERLVSAVETGLLPLNLAIEISKTDAKGAQKALMDAYTQKKLRGRKLTLVRRLIQQRELRGPHQIKSNALGRRVAKRALTSEGLVRAYQQEAARQKLLIKKAELAQSRLIFVREAFRKLCADEHFMTLLRAEGLETMPADLAQAVTSGPSS